jgi:hypothetical protein
MEIRISTSTFFLLLKQVVHIVATALQTAEYRIAKSQMNPENPLF